MVYLDLIQEWIFFFQPPCSIQEIYFQNPKMIIMEMARKEKQTVKMFPLILAVKTTLHWWLEDPITLVVLVGLPYIGG